MLQIGLASGTPRACLSFGGVVPRPKSGRPAALTAKVRRELETHLERSPQEFGLNRLQWDEPTLAVLLSVIRGAPVFLYRTDIARGQRLPFALSSAVPSLSIIVVITEIGVRAKTINPDIAAALIGAALLSVLLFPTIAGALGYTSQRLYGPADKGGSQFLGPDQDPIDSTTGAPLGSRNETGLHLSCALDKPSRLHGLSFGVEGSWLNQVGAAAQGRQLRVFANCEIPLNLR